ncbi:MAG: hypothetical protein IJJ10_03250 [Bacillus sp. (in: Bacteria)]|nr:hypothetical protein [Bacillus sp. (in: firmicutes)]
MNNELYHFNPYHSKADGKFTSGPSGSVSSLGNSNYSDYQRKRDEKLYGKKAVKRINKRMNQGEGVQSARHDEVVRNARSPYVKRTVRGALEIVGAVPMGNLASMGAYKLTGQKEVSQAIGAGLTIGMTFSGINDISKGAKGLARVNEKYR